MELKKLFGKRLRKLRAIEKVTQEKLADTVGLTIESISNMERGIHGPSFDNLEKIAAALNQPVKEFFTFDDID